MNRFYELRTEKALSQRTIARLLNVSQATYNNWENSRTEPSVAQLIKCAQLFGVSVDYLIGNSEEYGVINYTNRLLTDDESTLLGIYRALSPFMQKSLLNFLNDIKSD